MEKKNESNQNELIMPIDVIDYMFYNKMLLTNIKTQKIIYFFFKEAFKKELINIDQYENEKIPLFEAWVNGPVNYNSYRRYFQLIDKEVEIEEIKRENKLLNNTSFKETLEVLKKIFNIANKMSRYSLINLSHDDAWEKARKDLDEDIPSKNEIDLTDIKKSKSFLDQ